MVDQRVVIDQHAVIGVIRQRKYSPTNQSHSVWRAQCRRAYPTLVAYAGGKLPLWPKTIFALLLPVRGLLYFEDAVVAGVADVEVVRRVERDPQRSAL
jgi:hypothetical protein